MKPKKSVRVKQNIRYIKNRQKRRVEAKDSAKETTHESESNKNQMTNQKGLETPQQVGISRDKPYASN